jgi:hypothetical protein
VGRLEDTTRGRQLDERRWYTGFFDHDYLRVFGLVEADMRRLPFVVTLSGRAGKGVS